MTYARDEIGVTHAIKSEAIHDGAREFTPICGRVPFVSRETVAERPAVICYGCQFEMEKKP